MKTDTPKCSKCGGRTALISGYWNYTPDDEPYMNGVHEKVSYSEGDEWIHGYRCDDCNIIQGTWSDSECHDPPQPENKEVVILNDGSYKDYPEYGSSRSTYKHIRETLPNECCVDGVNVSINIDDLAGLLKSYADKATRHASKFQSRIKELEAEIERLKARL